MCLPKSATTARGGSKSSRSSSSASNRAHDARPLIAGAWIRPDHYGDPAAEVRNVRSKVGIIDVTPIGKLDLRGLRQVAEERLGQ